MADSYTHQLTGETFPCDDSGRPLIDLFRIDVSDRARLNYKDMNSLKSSIQSRGGKLIHAIALADQKDEKGNYKLLDGGRRTRACFELGIIKVPIVFFSNLSDVERLEIELEANIVREDFDMLEECELTRKIDELRRKTFGSATRGSVDQNDNAWTTQKTADLRGKSPATVLNEIKIATAVENDPALKEVIRSRKMPKTRALQYIEQMEEMKRLGALQESGGLILDNNILKGDCNELILAIPNNSIDCIITDPPFGNTTIEDSEGVSRGDGGGQSYLSTMEQTDNLSLDGLRKTFETLGPELIRVLKGGAYFYIFHAEDGRSFLTEVLTKCGLIVVQPSIIWSKLRNMNAFSGYNYMSMYEPILFGYKPPRTRRLNGPVGNIIECSPISSNEKLHAFQKPQELLSILIRNSTNPGDAILDPFCGSGSTIKTALALSRSAIGFELNEKNFAQAQKNLKGE